jgi:hypothetical protein
MKATQITLALVIAFATPLVAQDTTPAPPPAPAPAASAVSVEAVVARSVMDRAPVDTGSGFPADVGQLVLWTKVTGAAGSTIRHVWFHGDAEVGNVELTVGSSPYRTWSRKTVPVEWTGPWHVEVRDATGTVLRRIDFAVGQ